MELAEALNACPDAPLALTWLVKDCGYRIHDALGRWRDVCFYDGNALDYAYTLVNDCYGDMLVAMGNMAYYFDYESFSRDMLLGGDIATIDLPGVYHRVTITNANEF